MQKSGRKLAFLVLLFGLYACSNEYSKTNRAHKKQLKNYTKQLKSTGFSYDFVGTTNFSLRRPNYVIIHHTAQNACEQTLNTFTLPRTQVSAHYVICKNGNVVQMLNDHLRAWHAGRGTWGNLNDLNSASIGIEIDNNGKEPFTSQQMDALIPLLDTLKTKYKIPQANFIGHSDMAPSRKNDPNVNFDWQGLAENGFGIWYGDTSQVELPQNFDSLIYLKMIGYDTRDTLAVLQAFKRKYLKREDTLSLNHGDKKVLYSVWKEGLK